LQAVVGGFFPGCPHNPSNNQLAAGGGGAGHVARGSCRLEK
jgi:hypothetical protein